MFLRSIMKTNLHLEIVIKSLNKNIFWVDSLLKLEMYIEITILHIMIYQPKDMHILYIQCRICFKMIINPSLTKYYS